ncbi:MAG: CvpA family protein [Planctomycetes bacterium]|nr:CvpA family protein [Planctomycetota bacterium]
MNTIDALVLVVVAFNLLLGAIRGATWQILRLASIGLGIWAALRFADDFLAIWPQSLGLDPTYAPLIARVIVFLSVYLVMFGVTHLVKSMIDRVKLGGLDRLIGAGIGAIKGAFFCCVVLYLQFMPFVLEVDWLRDQLYGNPDRRIERSIANDLFVDFMKSRIDRVIPDPLKEQVRDLGKDVTERVIQPR